jgi:preprotein translocase subunit SecG
MLSIVINFLLTIHVIVSLLIVLAVLMQRPKNEGLGAAFGGGMTENLFGAQTTNVLQNFTRWLGALFFILTLVLSYLYVKKTGSHSTTQQQLRAKTEVPAPAATPVPVLPSGAAAPGGIQLEAATPAVKPEESAVTTPAVPPASELPVPTIPPPAAGDATPVPPATNATPPAVPTPSAPAAPSPTEQPPASAPAPNPAGAAPLNPSPVPTANPSAPVAEPAQPPK